MNLLHVSLIAIDVDGTLLTDNYTITPRTKRAIWQAKEMGMIVTLATGRSPSSCYPIVEELGLNDPLITHNGAVIVDPLTKKASRMIGFAVQDMQEVIHYCRKNQLHFDLNGAFDLYIESLTPSAEKMYKKFYMKPIVVDDIFNLDEQIVKFTIFAESEQLDQIYADLVRLGGQWRIIRSGENFIDIIHPNATKGAALRYILNQYNLDAEEVIAFGNYFNDLEMLQLVGLGVAMENSPEELKQMADRVTKTNNEDGVALILEEILDHDHP